MAKLYSREVKPELFSEEEIELNQVINAIEMAYSQIGTKDGYEQQDLIKDLREADLNAYEINVAISVLTYTNKIIRLG